MLHDQSSRNIILQNYFYNTDKQDIIINTEIKATEKTR